MRVTGSERALEFVLEDFKWYQKRLKIAASAAVRTPSGVGAALDCIKDGRRKRGGLLVRPQMPFVPRESDSGGLECHHPCLLPREI